MSELDIIFLSYQETNADKNWVELKSRFPRAKRVHGVRGIANAHRAAAEKSTTEFFFLVDGDNRIARDFQFQWSDSDLDLNTIYVWRCKNPVNDLCYGYGAVKLYNKSLLHQNNEGGFVDLASSVTKKYHIVHELASETYFFNSEEEAWRGAFRECTKLSSEIIHRQNSEETQERLKVWCEKANNVKNASWVLKGAQAGRLFGERVVTSDPNEIQKINDFQWLAKKFNEVRLEYAH